MFFLILFIGLPLISALLLAVNQNDTVRGIIVRITSLIIGIEALYVAIKYYSGGAEYFKLEFEPLGYLILGIEIFISLFLIFITLKHKKHLIAGIVIVQMIGMMWYELMSGSADHSGVYHIFIDQLSIIMMLIVAVIGGLICVYAVSYMRDYHHHHPEMKDRRSLFFSILFLFLSAMFGILFSDDLILLYLFWEVTTVCSFLLIGYTQTDEAVNNAFTALFMNVVGGLAFAFGLIYLGVQHEITGLKSLLAFGDMELLIFPALLLAIAGLTKAAQLPFSKWLLGAMVAPTPVSALLHSSTMVKAGVYLLIRVSPALAGNIAGMLVSFIGGLTFLISSFIAISQRDSKKVLAYSTIANLGLIVTCAGIGSYEAVWAAIMLIIFHAVSKSLLFLSVGKTEHIIGSRDIEDMHGLIVKAPEMALLLAVGIAGMFLAPFGMLISKWAAIVAFIESNYLFILLMIIFGSAATLFYWSKWLGKLAAVITNSKRLQYTIQLDESIALYTHGVLTIVLCALFPVLSSQIVQPYLEIQFKGDPISVINSLSMYLLIVMLGAIIVLPFLLRVFSEKNERIMSVYMAGLNTGDNHNFIGFNGQSREMKLSAWYIEEYFGEGKLLKPSIYLALVAIVTILVVSMGGVLA